MNNNEEYEAPPAHPFDNIAISLSGGGVRAVGYHLGTLDYLERAGMLEHVHTLSSVSGGSLVGIGYALSLKKGETFQEFYDNICEFLPELNTLEDLLHELEQREPPVASGSRTLITALANVYSKRYLGRYYGDPKFGIFWEDEPEIPLKEIIFNATEFKSGFAFRFQKSEHGSIIGNAMVSIPEEFAKQIRMSDIMAASSCIPGGMEPLMFPQDFHWPQDQWRSRRRTTRPVCDQVEQYLRDAYGIHNVPLMDGGVYDNQGITSIILTLCRRFRSCEVIEDETVYDQFATLEPIRPRDWARWVLKSMESTSATEKQKDLGEVDLFIVSDTPILRDPMYAVSQTDDAAKRGIRGWLRRRTLGEVDKALWVVTVMLAASLLALKLGEPGESPFLQTFYWVQMGFTGLLVAATVAAIVLVRLKGKAAIERAAQEMPPMTRGIWSYAKRLRLGQIWDMATLRASSMSALTARIFMNRIRQLGYSLLYSHEEFQRRVMDNNINDIGSITRGQAGDVPEFVMSPSAGVQAVVKRASEMGTKLWIGKPKGERHDLDVLIAAGHISTCFNVIEYLWQSHRDEGCDEVHDDVRELFEFAKRDWMRLNENPYCFLDRRRDAGRDSGQLFWESQQAHRRLWQRRSREARAAARAEGSAPA